MENRRYGEKNRRQGKLKVLTAADRQRKATRNARRARNSDAVRWQKAHVVRPTPVLPKVELRSKRTIMAGELGDAIVKRIDSATKSLVGKGVILPSERRTVERDRSS